MTNLFSSHRILLLVGHSNAGKSHFAEYYAYSTGRPTQIIDELPGKSGKAGKAIAYLQGFLDADDSRMLIVCTQDEKVAQNIKNTFGIRCLAFKLAGVVEAQRGEGIIHD